MCATTCVPVSRQRYATLVNRAKESLETTEGTDGRQTPDETFRAQAARMDVAVTWSRRLLFKELRPYRPLPMSVSARTSPRRTGPNQVCEGPRSRCLITAYQIAWTAPPLPNPMQYLVQTKLA